MVPTRLAMLERPEAMAGVATDSRSARGKKPVQQVPHVRTVRPSTRLGGRDQRLQQPDLIICRAWPEPKFPPNARSAGVYMTVFSQETSCNTAIRCLVPGLDATVFFGEWKDTLWVRLGARADGSFSSWLHFFKTWSLRQTRADHHRLDPCNSTAYCYPRQRMFQIRTCSLPMMSSQSCVRSKPRGQYSMALRVCMTGA